MRFINRGRGTGKTLMMIHTSYVTGMPIVVNSHKKACYIQDMAKQMGLDINVYSIEERQKLHGYSDILIDDAEEIINRVLNEYFGRSVTAVTVTIPMYKGADANDNL